MSEAPRKRGRPAGSVKVHPDRDRLIHFVVEWVIRQTGLGIGRGVQDPKHVDACILAAWLLSRGLYREEYLREDPNREGLIEAAKLDAGARQGQLAGVENVDFLLAQLQRVDHLTARHAYKSVRARHRWRSSVDKDVERAEATRQALNGEILPGPYMSDDG